MEEFDPPGTFDKQPDPRELAKALEFAIRPRLHLLKGNQPVRGFSEKGKSVRTFTQWKVGLEPGEYMARVQDKQTIDLRGGDNLILTLKRRDRKVYFEHSLYAAEEKDKLVRGGQASRDGLLVSVLKNQVNPKFNSVSQLITLEEEQGHGQGGLIQQQPPGFTWLEVKPRSARRRGSSPGVAITRIRRRRWRPTLKTGRVKAARK